MIIGVDAGALAVDDERLKVGVYKVTARLMEIISQIDSENNYRIYSHQGIGESERKWGNAMKFWVSPFRKGFRKLWLPIELLRHPVHVYLGLSQALPGFGLTSHIMDCSDVHLFVAKSVAVLQRRFRHRETAPASRNLLRFAFIRKKNGLLNQSVTTSGAFLPHHDRRIKSAPIELSAGHIKTKYIGFVYDLGFLHFPDAYPDTYRSLKQQTEDLVRRSDAIVTISNTVKKDVVDAYGVDPQLITVAYPGIDPRFSPYGPVHSQTRPYFLSVGALKRQKNIPGLLQAFSYFQKRSPKKYDLLLVGGDFWQDPQIEDTINRLGIGIYVIRCGYVPDAMLPAYYRGATGLVSPSLYEGFCLPAAEAMACGCPVIGSSTGAMKEVVGSSGICMKPNNIRQLSQTMLRLAQNAKVRSVLRHRGLRRAKRFTWDAFAVTVLKTIQSAAGTDHG